MTDYERGRQDQRAADAAMLQSAADWLALCTAGIRCRLLGHGEKIRAEILARAARHVREGTPIFAPPKVPDVPP